MLTQSQLDLFRRKYREDLSAPALCGALARTDIRDLAFRPMQAAKLSGEFSVEVKTRGITFQQNSGRCWMFAVLNMLREKVAERLNLEEFKLSGNYMSFWDRLEKANNVLEMAIETATKPMLDRSVEYILSGFHDGGYWDMAADLVSKYGVVPESAMPETYQSTHTSAFMKLLNRKLRADVLELRALVCAGQDPEPRRTEMLSEIYKMECIAFGEPPATFDFSCRDRDGQLHVWHDLTPKQFYMEQIGIDLSQYITITNHPTSGLPMNCHYRFHYIGSMAGSWVRNLNLTQKELQDLCIRQLRDGECVWFGCDSGAHGDRKTGVWDPDSVNYSDLFGGVSLDMSKRDRLESHESYADHAMILVGVNLDADGNPDRWKIENSWGEEVGRKGYFVCSQKYFEEYVYEAIIHRKYLTDAQAALLDTDPMEIPAWYSDWM
ncbi:MAG: C1 family peptidase [Clostridia bacterium]|nr:C1 family peptidase [Clostridia bacterium]